MARVISLLTAYYNGEVFWKSTNQKQELPVVAMFVNRSGQNKLTDDGCQVMAKAHIAFRKVS
jgi:hypothetical protein